MPQWQGAALQGQSQPTQAADCLQPFPSPHPQAIVQKRPRGRPPKRPLSGRANSSALSHGLAEPKRAAPARAVPMCSGMRYLPPAPAQAKPTSAIQAAPFCPGGRHAGFSCPPEHPLAHYSPADVVDWLRTTAATLTQHDRQWPHADRPTIGTSPAEEWQHQEVLLRIRIATHEEQQEIESALAEELGGVRRSARSRAAPDVYKPPADLGRGLQNLRAIQRMDDEPREVRQGEEYQAVSIPEVRPRPKKPDRAEAARLAEEPILKPGGCGPAGQPAPLHTHPLPQELHDSFGIGSMGPADAEDWTAEEQARFEEGLQENDRDFLETVKLGILTTKPIARQVGYYYNIWKTLSTDRARLWYYNLNEKKEDEKLDELRLEGRRNAEAARRYQQLAVLLRRKRLGEGMRWLRQAAIAPQEEHSAMEPAKKRIRAAQVSWSDDSPGVAAPARNQNAPASSASG
ncbi:hypothetical protein WJX84_001946 [Apatococcus fuscideae]|uniref:SANT domain-containing protein n=1 Tax=Apatococcus fuscideae TaxID=2026836 RepID=A0AAW1SZI1_9CHLO